MGGSNFVTVGPIPDSQNDGISHQAIGSSSGSTYLQAVAGGANPYATIIAGVSGKRIFVHAMVWAPQQGVGNNAVQFADISASGATVAFLTGPMVTSQAQLSTIPYSQYPWFTCAAGDSFCLYSGFGTVGIGGAVIYMQG
jgi:hypothetical protein